MSRTRLVAAIVAIGIAGLAGTTALRAEVVESGNYIILGATGVDDLVEILVDGEVVASCSWSTNYEDCGVRHRVDLGTRTTARITFRLTNHVYNGPCFPGPCGKYSGSFYVENARGEREWSDSVRCHVRDCPDGNTAGLKYDRTVTWQK